MWIGKSEILQNIYQRWFLPELEDQLKPTPVKSAGVCKGCTSDDVPGFIREMLVSHDRWGEEDLFVITSQDVRTAFDEMDHSKLHRSLHNRGICSHMCAVILRGLQGMQLQMAIPEAGFSGAIDMEQGGLQGGSVTPFCFRTMLEAIMEPLVREWEFLGYGARTTFGTRMTHIIWADNMWLLSNNLDEMWFMTQHLAQAIYEACFRWKESSLEIMIVGEGQEDNPFGLLSVNMEGQDMVYKHVQEMWVLGSLMDKRGRTSVSVSARIRVASNHYYRNLKVWNKPGNERMKITKWVEVFHGCMMHGARNWHVAKKVLADIRTLELRYLRKILWIRRRKLDGLDEAGNRLLEPYYKFLKRSAAMIEAIFLRNGRTLLPTKSSQAFIRRRGEKNNVLTRAFLVKNLHAQGCGSTPLRKSRTELEALPNKGGRGRRLNGKHLLL